MYSSNFGTGKHGNDDLRDLGHIDGHNITLFGTHSFEDIGKLGDLSVQGKIGIGPHIAGFSIPDYCQFILGLRIQMTVNGIGHHIGLAPGKPLVEWYVTVVQHFVPFLIPKKIFGLLGPEAFTVCDGFLIELIILFDSCAHFHPFAWVIE